MAEVTVKQEHRYFISLTEEEAVKLYSILFAADDVDDLWDGFDADLHLTLGDALYGT